MKKKVVLILFIIAFGVGGYFVQRVYNDKFNNSSLTTYGNVDIRDVSLGFEVLGQISQMNFEEGDRVNKGDLIAFLDKVPFEEDISLSIAQVDQAQANLVNAEKIYERASKLIKVGAVSQTDLDNALSARDQAVAGMDVAKAQLAKAKTNLEHSEIRAPNDGIILTRVREVGAIAAPGNTVYTLMLDRPVWIRTYVDEPSLGLVYPGQKAIVTTDSGGKYTGQVGFISPQAEFTPKNVETTQLRTDLVYRLRVIIDQPNEGLRQGMPVTVTLLKDSKK